jgi:hypothetical protein
VKIKKESERRKEEEEKNKEETKGRCLERGR